MIFVTHTTFKKLTWLFKTLIQCNALNIKYFESSLHPPLFKDAVCTAVGEVRRIVIRGIMNTLNVIPSSILSELCE